MLKQKFTCFLIIVLAVLAVQTHAQNYWLVSADRFDNKLYWIDPVTASVVSSLEVNLAANNLHGLSALAIDPISGELFAIGETDSGSPMDLLKINPGTGNATLIGGLNGVFAGLAFSTDGSTLYAVTGGDGSPAASETLYTIDKNNATLGPLLLDLSDGNGGETIAMSSTGLLYHVSGKPTAGSFRSIDPGNGYATEAFTLSGDSFNTNIKGFTYAANEGNFYATDGDGDNPGQLYRVYVNGSADFTEVGAINHIAKGLVYGEISVPAFPQSYYPVPGPWDILTGKPLYIGFGYEIYPETLEWLETELPEGGFLPVLHPYIVDSTNPDLNIPVFSDTDFEVTFVQEVADYRNLLGYYTYDTLEPPLSIEDIESTMTVIFPNSSKTHSDGDLASGDTVMIGTIPAGKTLGWFLAVNAFDPDTGEITKGDQIYFSNENLNPEVDPELKKHNVLLLEEIVVDGQNQLVTQPGPLVVLGFEDMNREDLACDHDFNDVLFFVTSLEGGIEVEHLPVLRHRNLVGEADVVVTKKLDQELSHDNFIHYTITVTNNGPDDATGVKVTEYLPKPIKNVESIASKGTYSREEVIWEIGDLANGESVTLAISAHVETSEKILLFSALGVMDQKDPAKDNNCSILKIKIYQ